MQPAAGGRWPACGGDSGGYGQSGAAWPKRGLMAEESTELMRPSPSIKEAFSDERQGVLLQRPHRAHQTTERGHGRRDERHYVLAKLPAGSPLRDEWPGFESIGMAVRNTEQSNGVTSGDVRYFISSAFMRGKRYAEAVRSHWTIENALHWVWEVTFDEDHRRTRKRRIADNLSWLRRFAISLLKRHPSKNSIKGKSRIAGWNNDFLMEVFTAQGVQGALALACVPCSRRRR